MSYPQKLWITILDAITSHNQGVIMNEEPSRYKIKTQLNKTDSYLLFEALKTLPIDSVIERITIHESIATKGYFVEILTEIKELNYAD